MPFFLKHYQRHGTTARKPGSGIPPKLSPAIQQLIENVMRQDDETTGTRLQAILAG
jgi:transposase